VKKQAPKEFFEEYKDHKITQSKCYTERDALGMCLTFYGKGTQCQAFKEGMLLCLKNQGMALVGENSAVMAKRGK